VGRPLSIFGVAPKQYRKESPTTYRAEYSIPDDFLEEIAEQGLDVVPELIHILLKVAMRIERQRYLGVEPYERSPQRRRRANGYKSKTIATRMGKIAFDLPQVRERLATRGHTHSLRKKLALSMSATVWSLRLDYLWRSALSDHRRQSRGEV
jgi:hypothetical protein